jgi:hypothetical protein
VAAQQRAATRAGARAAAMTRRAHALGAALDDALARAGRSAAYAARLEAALLQLHLRAQAPAAAQQPLVRWPSARDAASPAPRRHTGRAGEGDPISHLFSPESPLVDEPATLAAELGEDLAHARCVVLLAENW